MLPLSLWNTLLSHHIHVIALGDPFQIPVINPNEDNHILDKPHIFLDEIMRQALDSEIIRFSMWIRNGGTIADYQGENKEVKILDSEELNTGVLAWADQILCATNATRNQMNIEARKIKGFSDTPQIGDKIIGLTNHWDFSDPPLTNGSIGTITDAHTDFIRFPRYISSEPVKILRTTMIDEIGNVFYDIPIDYNCLMTGKKSLSAKQEIQIKNSKMLKEAGLIAPFDFAYGYAITCHKFQGSSAPKILVFEEQFPFDPIEHARWVYTAATRSEDRLVFIKR